MSDYSDQRDLAKQLVLKSNALGRSPRFAPNMFVAFDDLRALVEGVDDAVRLRPHAGRGRVKVTIVADVERDRSRNRVGLPSVAGWTPDSTVFAFDFGASDPEYGCELGDGQPVIDGVPQVAPDFRKHTLELLREREGIGVPSDVCGIQCEGFVQCRYYRTLRAAWRVVDFPRRDAFKASISALTTRPPVTAALNLSAADEARLVALAQNEFGTGAAAVVTAVLTKQVPSFVAAAEAQKVVAQFVRIRRYQRFARRGGPVDRDDLDQGDIDDLRSILDTGLVVSVTHKPVPAVVRQPVMPDATKGRLTGHFITQRSLENDWAAYLISLGATAMGWQQLMTLLTPSPKPSASFPIALRAAIAAVEGRGGVASRAAVAAELGMTDDTLKRRLGRAKISLRKLRAQMKGP